MAPEPLAQWSVDDVCTWLSAIGLGSKAAPFKENGVDGALLETLTAEDLSGDLGLSNIQAKKILLELDFISSLTSGGGGGGGGVDEEVVQQLQDELTAKDAKIQALEEELAALKAPEPEPAPAPAPKSTTTYHEPARPPPRREHHVVKGAAGGAAKGAVTGAVIGAIAGDPAAGAKAGAAGGATMGAMQGVGRNRRAARARRRGF